MAPAKILVGVLQDTRSPWPTNARQRVLTLQRCFQEAPVSIHHGEMQIPQQGCGNRTKSCHCQRPKGLLPSQAGVISDFFSSCSVRGGTHGSITELHPSLSVTFKENTLLENVGFSDLSNVTHTHICPFL